MKIVAVFFCVVFAFFMADFFYSQKPVDERMGMAGFGVSASGDIPFDHSLHGDSLGLDCTKCHTGSRSMARAYMPSKADCMDCHRLPLTEKPGIEKLDSALVDAPVNPWKHKSVLPEHVVFHHGVHAAAGVTCSDCHGGASRNVYGGESFNMKSCLLCHRGETDLSKNLKRASTECAACHR